MTAYAQWSLEAHLAEHRALGLAGKMDGGGTDTITAFPFYDASGEFDPIDFVVYGFLPFYTADGASKPIHLKQEDGGRLYWIRYWDQRTLQVEAGSIAYEFETDYKLVKCFASLRLAPLSSPVVLNIKLNSTVVGTLTFPPGETLSNVAELGLVQIEKNDKITIDVVSLGAPAAGLLLTLTYK